MTTKEFQRWYEPKDYFHYFNPNPEAAKKKTFKWDRSDCTLRALVASTGCSWLAAFDYTSGKARKDYTVQNDGNFLRKWLIEDGVEWHALKAEKGKSRVTAREFAEQHKEGTWILSLANHWVGVNEGMLRDTWNCGEKTVYGYFNMTDFKLPEPQTNPFENLKDIAATAAECAEAAQRLANYLKKATASK